MDYVWRRVTMHVTSCSWYDPAQDLYYYTKGEALEAAESAEEFAKVFMQMVERAGAMGMEYALKATKMIMEMLQPASELGGKWMDIALDMLAQYWGYHRGDGERAASDVVEVELAQIFARHSSGGSNSSSPCPTE